MVGLNEENRRGGGKKKHGSDNKHLAIHKPHNPVNPQDRGFMCLLSCCEETCVIQDVER